MCDIIVAAPQSTATRVMLFGKNSDRQPNEAQIVECVAAARHCEGSKVVCTYIDVPQVLQTHGTLICRPFWMWGAEMGANTQGVVIGNEGLHARSPPPRAEALTGMDMVRLALERAATAREAVEVITSLLHQYGQGGNCGHLEPAYYNNGFVIADAKEAFVLETVERDWVLEGVRAVRSLSNRFSIGTGSSRPSEGMLNLLRARGWSMESTPNFAEAIADPNREHIGNAKARQQRSSALLAAKEKQLTAAEMMNILRDHGGGNKSPSLAIGEVTSQRTLCMHATIDRPGQTVGSMVSELDGQHAVHWVTATSAPCLSIFRPVLMDVPVPAHGPSPTDRFDARTLWWKHELIHRASSRNELSNMLHDILIEREALEAQFIQRIGAVVRSGNEADRRQAVCSCWQEAEQVEDRWLSQIEAVSGSARSWHAPNWEALNRIAGLGSDRP
jgi:secernin